MREIKYVLNFMVEPTQTLDFYIHSIPLAVSSFVTPVKRGQWRKDPVFRLSLGEAVINPGNPLLSSGFSTTGTMPRWADIALIMLRPANLSVCTRESLRIISSTDFWI